MYICQHCQQELRYVQRKGWAHLKGQDKAWPWGHKASVVEKYRFTNSKVYLEIWIGDGKCKMLYRDPHNSLKTGSLELAITTAFPNFVCGFHMPAAPVMSRANKTAAFIDAGFFSVYRHPDFKKGMKRL